MKRALLLAMLGAVILPFTTSAQGKPDFSGTWTMDAARSDPAPAGRGGGGGAATVTIKQTASELTVQSEGRQGPQTMTYKLDGSESKNEQMGRGGAMTVVSKAKWDGSSAGKSWLSIAWLSITGRNGAGSTLTGFSARPSIQANSCA